MRPILQNPGYPWSLRRARAVGVALVLVRCMSVVVSVDHADEGRGFKRSLTVGVTPL
jgi:hypothetical protein